VRRAAFWLVLVIFAPLFAGATTLIPPSDLGELALRSGVVVVAVAGPSRVSHRGPLLFTRTEFTVTRSLAGGPGAGQMLEVEVPGGQEKDGGWLVAGSPRFESGETYLLFLTPARDACWRPPALAYGLLRASSGTGGRRLLVPLPEAAEAGWLAEPAGRAIEPVGTYLESCLLDHLEEVLVGRAAWNGRKALAPPEALPPSPDFAPPSTCAFMNAGYNLRWNAFDGGSTTVSMFADAKGDPSISGGGFSQVQGAISGWMAVPNTSLNLGYGGTMSYSLHCSADDDAPPAGTHLVVFDDPCSDMDDLISCTGVLAFGGPWYGGTHTFDGATWYTIQSWFVVVNNGTGCIGSTNYRLMLQHELGHGLGFGHVSDPGALMYAYCCNSANATDIACAQYTYPVGSSPTLAVQLAASPAGGALPLPVTLTADVSGSATGSLTYAFWWNCTNTGTSIGSVSSGCGSLPNPAAGSCAENDKGARCNQVTADPQSVTHTYDTAGTFTAKVIVERGSVSPVESRSTVSVTGIPPLAPSNLVATALSSSQITVSWKDNSSDELGFKLERKTGSGAWSQIATVSSDKTGYQNSGLQPSTLYSYRVRAYGPGGDSPYSNEYGATTQTSTFVASASAWPSAGAAPLVVHFTAEGQGGQSPYLYDWDFGDGTAHASQQNPEHAYESGGTFEWLLTVSDAASKTATAAGTVEVGAPLSALASAQPLSGDAPLTVRFAGSASGGTIPYTFGWTFGDGASSSATDPVHTYADPGVFTAALTVTDGTAQTAASSVSIHATTPVPPPVIALVQALTSPFRLRISGLNFHPGCTVLIDGTSVPQTVWKSSALLVAKGGSALKALVPKGTPVQITVVNHDDGGVSGSFPFTR
jgi:PKD repeat protein